MPEKQTEATTSLTTSIVPRYPELMNLAETLNLGEVLARSGMFPDVRQAAQAVVKIMVGRELGFGPMASLIDIHMIEGKPSVGAHLKAAAIKRSGKYDYKVKELTRQRCELEFFELDGRGKPAPVGTVAMTMQEAIDTGLALATPGKGCPLPGTTPPVWLKTNWYRSGDDMLFARCLSKGYRRYCPDLTGGVLVYDPDEMDRDGLVEVPPSQAPSAIPPGPVDASYTITHPNGQQTHVNDAPQPPPPPPAPAPQEAPLPNSQAPAPSQPAEELTPQEYEEVVAAIRALNRTVADVTNICQAAGVPVLQKIPRSRLPWLAQAIQGFAPLPTVNAISALVEELKIPWDAVKARLKERYQVSSFGHLLPGQAAELLQMLTAAKAQRQAQQPTAA